MIAYYVHWIYPASADDALYYAGYDDEKLFHRESNAMAYANKYLKEVQDKLAEAYKLEATLDEIGRSPTEEEYKILSIIYEDTPINYSIHKRDIKFEDEE